MTPCDHVLRDCDAETTVCLLCGHTFTRRDAGGWTPCPSPSPTEETP